MTVRHPEPLSVDREEGILVLAEIERGERCMKRIRVSLKGGLCIAGARYPMI